MTAVIFNIVRSSLHDGDGLRTVVYFKGCPLRCRWCHNPESFDPRPRIMRRASRCIKCGRCTEICPARHVFMDGDIYYNRDGCVSCGKCAGACPNGALTLCGEAMSIDAVFDEAAKDKDYYDKTGGGVTLSGGECLLYPEFCSGLLDKFKKSGIHTAIETSLHADWASVEAVLPVTDLFLVDIKHADPEAHARYTGKDNAKIIRNLVALSNIHADIWIRIPLIPGVNDGERDLAETARLVNGLGGGVRRVELLKYNNLARSKYAALGMPVNELLDLGPQDDAAMQKCGRALEAALKPGLDVLY